MLVRARISHFDDEEFILLLPKSLGTKDRTIMNFPATPIKWDHTEGGNEIRGAHTIEGDVSFEVKATARADRVEIRVEVENLSNEALQDLWLFTFLAPHGAPSFQDVTGERTLFPMDGAVISVSEAPWPESETPHMAVFPARGNAERLPQQLRDLNVESAGRSTGGWMLAERSTGDGFVAIVSPNPLFLFRNQEISSLHAAPLLGDVPPGGKVVVRYWNLFGEGDREEALQAVEEASVELARTGLTPVSIND